MFSGILSILAAIVIAIQYYMTGCAAVFTSVPALCGPGAVYIVWAVVALLILLGFRLIQKRLTKEKV